MSVATDYRAIFEPRTPQNWRYWCPVCCRGGGTGKVRRIIDRYGYKFNVWGCLRCGLRWFNPSISKKAYADFYQSGAYRRLVSAYHGREMGGNEFAYMQDIALFTDAAYITDLKVLDIGGAPDGILPHLNPTIIDPAIDGQTAETFDPAGRQWDLITVCQTVDHLLEPGAVFKKLAGCLAPGGVLFFDVVDFDATREYKIDHPCNFNARSATMLAHVAGLRIDKMERSGNHLRYLCRHW